MILILVWTKVKSVLKVHHLIAMHGPPKQRIVTNCETAIQGHSRSSVVVPIDRHVIFY